MLISFYSNLLNNLKPKQRLLTDSVSILITLQGWRKTFFCTKKCWQLRNFSENIQPKNLSRECRRCKLAKLKLEQTEWKVFILLSPIKIKIYLCYQFVNEVGRIQCRSSCNTLWQVIHMIDFAISTTSTILIKSCSSHSNITLFTYYHASHSNNTST